VGSTSAGCRCKRSGQKMAEVDIDLYAENIDEDFSQVLPRAASLSSSSRTRLFRCRTARAARAGARRTARPAPAAAAAASRAALDPHPLFIPPSSPESPHAPLRTARRPRMKACAARAPGSCRPAAARESPVAPPPPVASLRSPRTLAAEWRCDTCCGARVAPGGAGKRAVPLLQSEKRLPVFMSFISLVVAVFVQRLIPPLRLSMPPSR